MIFRVVMVLGVHIVTPLLFFFFFKQKNLDQEVKCRVDLSKVTQLPGS